MPSERKLSEMYSLSRTTVRLALQDLESKGYISSIHGKGSLVIYNGTKLLDALKFEDFSNEEEYNDQKIKKIVIGNNIVNNRYKNIFFREEKLIEFSQIIYINSTPSILERKYIPYIDINLTESEDKLNILNHEVSLFLDNYSATVFDEPEYEYMDVELFTPCIHLIRKAYNKNNELLFFSEIKLRIDKFNINSMKVIKRS